MAEAIIDRVSGLNNIEISDVLGLWEVIRINRVDENPVYPWIKERFKFNFIDDMVFECLRDGQQNHGTWEISEKAFETMQRFSIILNGIFEYRIVDIDEDEITLSDQMSKFLLTRRL